MNIELFNPLQVSIKIFQGPLDALLHLIKKKKLDIQTVPLVELCVPFLEYVKEAKKFNLENVGHFVSIAASLVAMKTRSLLPHTKIKDEEEIETEETLRKQLIEYDKIKKMSNLLAKMKWLYTDTFPRAKTHKEKDEVELNIPDLLSIYKNIKEQIKKEPPKFNLPEFRVNSENIFSKILANFKQRNSFSLQELFCLFYLLQEKIAALILMLELCRLHWIRIEQKEYLGEIFCYTTTKFANASTQTLLSYAKNI